MNIRLGNLSLQEMQNMAGVEFPIEFVDFMDDKRQENVSIAYAENTWHCFHIPFELVVCGEDMIEMVKKHLVPIGKDFKQPMQVSVYSVK